MAGTADDNSTGEEWTLLCDARALVVRYCKSETTAQELLLDFAGKGYFKRYHWFAPDSPRERTGAGIDPRLWGTSSECVEIVVDWDASCVTYARKFPSDRFGLMLIQGLRDFLPADPQCRMLLVRLHRDDLLAMLRAAGLLEPMAEAAPKEAVAPEPAITAPGETPAPVEEAQEAPATDPKRPQRQRWQLSRAIRALRALYPPEGKVPHDQTIDALRGEIATYLASENKNLDKASPRWDVVNDAVEKLGRRAAPDGGDSGN
jgi:hypothetical protein